MSKEIPVKFNGEVVGYAESGNISKLRVTNEKFMAHMQTMDEPIFISSRKKGTLNNDGTISDISDIEHVIIKPE